MLSFPLAAQLAGLPLLLAATVVFSLLAAYMDLILAEFAQRYRRLLPSRTFAELVVRALGPHHYAGVLAQVIFGLVGTLVGFTCIMADLLTPVVVHACSLASPSTPAAAACSVLSTRASVIALFSVCIALPLAGCSRMHSLRGISAFAVAAVLAVAGVVVARGAIALSSGAAAANLPAMPRGGISGVLLMLPIVIYAAGNHVQSVTIFLECDGPARRVYATSVFLAYAVITVMYALTAAFGVAAFGSAVLGDVLENFALGEPAADVAKVLMAIHVAVVVPVDTIPLRRSFSLALRLCMSACSRGAHPAALIDASEAGESLVNNDSDLLLQSYAADSFTPARETTSADAPDTAAEAAYRRMLALARKDEAEEAALPQRCGCACSRGIAAQTVGLVLGAGVVAIAFPQVNIVFGLLGATLGVTCMWGYPALFLLARAREIEERRAAALGCSLQLGVQDEPRDVSRERASEGDDCGDGSDGDDAALRFIPSSPFWLRAQAYGLLALSVAMIVLGTGVYIWSTWIKQP